VTQEEYLSYIVGSIETYSTKEKKQLITLFFNEGVAYKEIVQQTQISDMEAQNITGLELSEQIKKCITGNNKAVRIFEKWEFTKDYKYSIICKTDDYDVFASKVKNDSRVKADENESAYMSDVRNVPVIFKPPIIFEMDDFLILKYNLKFEALHPQTEEELLIKYPLIIVLHKNEKLIEFRFDDLKRIFYYDTISKDKLYLHLTNIISDNLKNDYKIDISPLDLDFIKTKAKDSNEVKLIANYMKTSIGGNAILEVGNNKEYILPFIGELNLLMREKKEEFNKAPVIKELLEQFIYEKEEMSDYPWIVVLWEAEKKTRNITVKFIFNYMNSGFCLMQHYYNNVLVGMERMNHVVRFIGENREDCPK